ncbi:hypothetical protein N7478_008049 [Penicillium angulare]|uniref:uncharacterized protein n=1 Tax=Penicillium angulare TaxID=116970 RepID=UPI0025425401|nr:uncharacterized protein N7478_008049 [Penicillium angulare]KAJ5272924.1 hypothetical protein N7478_008049 [Penicillium angulare]
MESQQGAVPQRLNFLKCIRCRDDKKQFLPFNRKWLGQKCNRCAQRDYACSQSRTAKYQKMIASREEPSTNTPINCQARGLQCLRLSVEISQEDGGDGQPDGTFVAPKCALLFDNLENATWNFFGAPLGFQLGVLLARIEAVETDAIYDVLQSRLALMNMLQDYKEVTKEGKSKGIVEQESQIFASRKVMINVRRTAHFGEKYVGDFIQSFDFRMKVARRL